MSRRRGLTDSVRGFIFDVDGVIADTAVLHTAAWRRLAAEEGLPFDENLADQLRGVSRSESLRILLGDVKVSPERFEELAARKNSYYGECLSSLTEADVLPGVRSLMDALSSRGVRIAAVSVSRNARTVLIHTRMIDAFDIVIDGNDLPRFNPTLNRFQHAARLLRVEPGACVVVEDSATGVAAARAAGMRSVGIGDADRLCVATVAVDSLRDIDAARLLTWLSPNARHRPSAAFCSSR